MSPPRLGQVTIAPCPDHPGWLLFENDVPDAFHMGVLGRLLLRQESDRTCRVRAHPTPLLRNLFGGVHGGAVLGMIDTALFGALRVLTGELGALGTTVDTSTQFIGVAAIDQPLDAVVELLRETRRLIFLRGTIEQDGQVVAAFSGTVRKASSA